MNNGTGNGGNGLGGGNNSENHGNGAEDNGGGNGGMVMPAEGKWQRIL
jgi:hypothetical protein